MCRTRENAVVEAFSTKERVAGRVRYQKRVYDRVYDQKRVYERVDDQKRDLSKTRLRVFCKGVGAVVDAFVDAFCVSETRRQVVENASAGKRVSRLQ
jgi:hypothetical protein